jgi:hypothetical protein
MADLRSKKDACLYRPEIIGNYYAKKKIRSSVGNLAALLAVPGYSGSLTETQYLRGQPLRGLPAG